MTGESSQHLFWVTIREKMVENVDGGEDYFCIGSKSIEIWYSVRAKRCSIGKNDIEKFHHLDVVYHKGFYYYGYKLYAVCGLSGVIHSFDLTKVSVYDIHYLKDVKVDYSDCTVIGDRGYISVDVQLELLKSLISDWKFHIKTI